MGIPGMRISPDNTSKQAKGSGLEISVLRNFTIIDGKKLAKIEPIKPAACPVAVCNENIKTRSFAEVAAIRYGWRLTKKSETPIPEIIRRRIILRRRRRRTHTTTTQTRITTINKNAITHIITRRRRRRH